jgi:hypothetical protein
VVCCRGVTNKGAGFPQFFFLGWTAARACAMIARASFSNMASSESYVIVDRMGIGVSGSDWAVA